MYHDLSNSALKAAHCEDPSCERWTLSVVDEGRNTNVTVGRFAKMTLGSDGLAVAVYYALDQLRVARCVDVRCQNCQINVIDPHTAPRGESGGEKTRREGSLGFVGYAVYSLAFFLLLLLVFLLLSLRFYRAGKGVAFCSWPGWFVKLLIRVWTSCQSLLIGTN